MMSFICCLRTKFAQLLDVAVSVPRVVTRQVHRSNIPADNPEDYYRKNIMIPFLDHILVEMRDRFSSVHQQKVKLLGLIPSIAVTYDRASVEEVGQLYETDLPFPQVLGAEYRRWKALWKGVVNEDRPNTLQGALYQCDMDSFPNIHVLLAIVCTLPITVSENERSIDCDLCSFTMILTHFLSGECSWAGN